MRASWQRVAAAIAAEEKQDRELWTARFFSLLDNFRILPGGRILAGAGTGHRVTLFNCFVMGDIADDLEHIFDALKEGALIAFVSIEIDQQRRRLDIVERHAWFGGAGLSHGKVPIVQAVEGPIILSLHASPLYKRQRGREQQTVSGGMRRYQWRQR